VNQYTFKLPDLGEGTVSAELVAWHVKPGDRVVEDQVIAEVMTDKASVELPSPVSGHVTSITGSPGETIAVGSALIVFDLAEGPVTDSQPTAAAAGPGTNTISRAPAPDRAPAARAQRVQASPSVRRMAREAGMDLEQIQGSGPHGRISREDLSARLSKPASSTASTQEIKVTGLRRVIAQRMTEAMRTIPHFAYVEEVDVTALESLRSHLNSRPNQAAPLTYLPFIITALVRALESYPQCNATYDSERGVIVRHGAVHVGIATQTQEGLVVPVVRNAQSRSIWDLAVEIQRLAAAVRAKKAQSKELSGSTITLSSLGKLGGIASTPIINSPEVAIIGINKAVERPMVHSGAVVVRRMMNLSSSFDHRFVDGHDAAAMIQALKVMLENPATLFLCPLNTIRSD